MPSSKSSRGYVIALAATVLWSSTGVFISYLNRTYAVPALVLAFWRDLFVSLALFLVFGLFQRGRFSLSQDRFGFMVLFGLVLALFNGTWTFSVQFNGAAVATVLAFSSPAFTAVLSRWFLHEKITPLKLLSILLSILGTVLVANAFNIAAWHVNPFGILFGLTTGFVFACYNLMGKTAADQGIDSWTTMLYSFGAATVFLLLFNLIFDAASSQPILPSLLWLQDRLPAWGLVFLLAVGPTLGGFVLYTLSLGYLPATVTNLIASLEPILTAVWAYLVFGEQLTPVQFIGGMLVVSGVILIRLRD